MHPSSSGSNTDWPRELGEHCFWNFFRRDYFSWLHDTQIDKFSKAKDHFRMYRCQPDGYYNVYAANYLSGIESDSIRNTVARFRTSCHPLEVETGRWKHPKPPRSDRQCKCCHLNLVEDEFHFIFYCPLYYKVRGEHYPVLFENRPRDLASFFLDNPVEAGIYVHKCLQLRELH